MEISELLKNLIYFMIASGLITWLIQSLVKKWIDKDIELYKWKLSKESIRFSQLYGERAKILRDLYHKLFDFEEAMKSYTSPMQWAGDKPMKDKHAIAYEKGNDFRDFYRKNRIYLTPKVLEILDKMDKIFIHSWIDFTTDRVYDNTSRESMPGERMERWVKVWNKMCDDIPALRKELEKEFRETLGVE